MKFFIVGLHSCGKQEILSELEKLGVPCGRLFSNITQYDARVYNSQYYELYNDEEIKELFENNAYVFYKDITILNNKYEGLSLYEFDRKQVFALSPDQFLSLPNKPLDEELVIVWLDNNKLDRQNRFKQENRLYNFKDRDSIEKLNEDDFIANIYNFPKSNTLYFCNEDPQRVAAIIYSISTHPDLLEVFARKFN